MQHALVNHPQQHKRHVIITRQCLLKGDCHCIKIPNECWRDREGAKYQEIFPCMEYGNNFVHRSLNNDRETEVPRAMVARKRWKMIILRHVWGKQPANTYRTLEQAVKTTVEGSKDKVAGTYNLPGRDVWPIDRRSKSPGKPAKRYETTKKRLRFSMESFLPAQATSIISQPVKLAKETWQPKMETDARGQWVSCIFSVGWLAFTNFQIIWLEKSSKHCNFANTASI
jgi:hypothetical protein